MTEALERTDFTSEAVRECRRVQGLTRIDRVQIGRIRVDLVDQALLFDRATVEQKTNPETNEVTYTITIKNDIVPMFQWTFSDATTKRTSMQTKVLGKWGNLVCDSDADFLYRLEQIQENLTSYGINVSYEEAVISQIELNKTMLTPLYFHECQRALLILMSVIPDRYGIDKEGVFGNKGLSRLATIYGKGKNAEMEWIMYDKTSELLDKEGIDVPGQFLRLEVKLKNRNVKRLLGIDKVSDLSNEKIEKAMQEMVNDCFVEPYYEWEETRISEMADMFKQEFDRDEKHFIRNTLVRISALDQNITPYIFDRQMISRALDRAGLFGDDSLERKHKQRAHEEIKFLTDNVFTAYRDQEYKVSFFIGKMYDRYITAIDV